MHVRWMVVLMVLLWGCSSESSSILESSYDTYLPSSVYFKDGFVSKYYVHSRPKSNQSPKTNILYRKTRILGDTMIMEDFNAGYQKIFHRKLTLLGSEWKSMKEYSIFQDEYFSRRGEQVDFRIESPTMIKWDNVESEYHRVRLLDGNELNIVEVQKNMEESSYEEKKAITFSGERVVTSTYQGEENRYVSTWERTFAERLGMVHFISDSEDVVYEWELVEQMSATEFHKRQSHGTHRVAYIDTTQVMIAKDPFKPCSSIGRIADYYNDDRSGIKGGKGRLRYILRNHLDSDKLNDESGYLTFRFVINCAGEAGWFTTEEADLDFNKKSFSEESKLALSEVLMNHTDWKPLRIRGEEKDSYAYTTFKLKDGEIIEILP